MTSFDRIVNRCLDLIAAGQASADQCLAEYPEHREEMEPLLRAAEKVASLKTIEPSAAYRRRGRQALEAHMRANPRTPRRPGLLSRLFDISRPTRRLATSLVAVMFALLSTGTVLAQGALPGDPLYGWKLQTEQLWRPFSGEKTAYELRLSDRRAQEYLLVYQQPELAVTALHNYTDSLMQLLIELELRPDQVVAVYDSLLNQQKELTDSGLNIPELDAILRTLTPADTQQSPNDTEAEESPAPTEEQDQESSGGATIATGDSGIPGLLSGVATAVAPILNP